MGKFSHKVHYFDSKGKQTKVHPYTKICSKGNADLYFVYHRNIFVDPGTNLEMEMSFIPDDIFEKYMKQTKEQYLSSKSDRGMNHKEKPLKEKLPEEKKQVKEKPHNKGFDVKEMIASALDDYEGE